MKNKIAGTNFIKNKYEISSLTKDDLDYLIKNNIKCYRIPIKYESKFLFTSFESLARYLISRYNKEEFLNFMQPKEITKLKKLLQMKHISFIDLVAFQVEVFDLKNN